MIRRLVLLMALIALLTACGGAPAVVEPTAPAATAPTSAPAAPAPTAAPATDRSALIAEGIAKARAFTPVLTPREITAAHRLIAQEGFGDIEAPLSPQRIVTLDPSLTDAVIALGFGDAIVGTIVDYNGDVFHEHIADRLGPDVVKLGYEDSPNLERIVALDPDLILTWDWYPDNVPQLQQVAPTAVMSYTTYEQQVGQTYSNEQYVTWLVREVAAVLGAEDRVETALQPFRDRITEGRAALQAALGDQTVGFVDIRQEKILISGYGSDGISALLYGDLGVRPDPLSEQLYVWEELSLEQIPELTADQMLAFVDGADAQERYAELTQNPLWQRVPAVQNGKVFVVPSGLYYRGDDGPLGSIRVIDDILAKLADGSASATAPAAPSAALQVLEETGEYRLIKHSLGETRVPLRPQRIISLAPGELTDTLIALGNRPIGSVSYGGASDAGGYPPALAEQIAGITSVGDAGEPNLEQIALLAPDLIVAPLWLAEDYYPQLAQIAPTVVISDARDFRVWLDEVARAIGAEEAAAQVLRDYQTRVAELRRKLEGTQISVVRPRSENILLYGPRSAAGVILTELGLAVQDLPADAEDWGGDGLRAIGRFSLEWVPNISGDHIFVITYNLQDQSFEQLIQQPLWQQLPAVQQGGVHAVEGTAWTNHGPLGVMRLIDEVEAALVQE